MGNQSSELNNEKRASSFNETAFSSEPPSTSTLSKYSFWRGRRSSRCSILSAADSSVNEESPRDFGLCPEFVQGPYLAGLQSGEFVTKRRRDSVAVEGGTL